MSGLLTQKDAARELGIDRGMVGTLIRGLGIETVTQPGKVGKFIDRAGLRKLRAAIGKPTKSVPLGDGKGKT